MLQLLALKPTEKNIDETWGQKQTASGGGTLDSQEKQSGPGGTLEPQEGNRRCRSKPTAMMLSNIPCKVSDKELHDALQSMGFAGTYNSVCLPKLHHACKKGHKQNAGYAFVKLKTSNDAERFAIAFADFQFPGTQSAKACTVKAADLQDVERSKKSRRN